MNQINNENQDKPSGGTFSKRQLLSSKVYTELQKDLLSAVLDAEQSYSHQQAQTLLATYLKKEVM
ncbi:hypothetical protein [Paenibacillus radicis (ex Gao et al. 2016)]|uniref:Uncharacterized protein n=1 Tax=Paenibacillus radicis (ex Gao et al. 2016) TaxID=1737354 RepID=A0A917HJN6_9BACL|nr:hypothetical protein [Paenibacillus radicis (ex Gao et al. 2016)]GGG81815.1 hypothetical protein GCM10010918_43880 [Paenibacillus radicis (ex Gao et al. 2016)]